MLTGSSLRHAVAQCVRNYDNDLVHGCSLDIRLGKMGAMEDVDFYRATAMIDILRGQRLATKEVDLQKGLPLKPGELLLAETEEVFDMRPGYSAVVTLRSMYARNGLEHASSLVLHPGWSGNLMLELRNVTRRHWFVLRHLEAVAQVHFFYDTSEEDH